MESFQESCCTGEPVLFSRAVYTRHQGTTSDLAGICCSVCQENTGAAQGCVGGKGVHFHTGSSNPQERPSWTGVTFCSSYTKMWWKSHWLLAHRLLIRPKMVGSIRDWWWWYSVQTISHAGFGSFAPHFSCVAWAEKAMHVLEWQLTSILSNMLFSWIPLYSWGNWILELFSLAPSLPTRAVTLGT